MAETSTNERRPTMARDKIIEEAQRLEERTRDSSKGHFNAAQGCKNLHLWLGIPTIILSTIISATVFSKYASDHEWISLVGGILSIIVAILSAITTFLNPADERSAHFIAANAYDQLNNDCRVFWSIECWAKDATDDVLTSRLKEFVDRKNKLNSSSPQIPKSAYDKARLGVADGEATYDVDKLRVTSRPTHDQLPKDGGN